MLSNVVKKLVRVCTVSVEELQRTLASRGLEEPAHASRGLDVKRFQKTKTNTEISFFF